MQTDRCSRGCAVTRVHLHFTTAVKSIDIAHLATICGGAGKGTPIFGLPGWTEQVKSKGIDLKVRAIDPKGHKGPSA